jgi:hypothetical protein
VDSVSLLPLVESHYERHFGSEPSRASVSFVGVEQIEVLRFVQGTVAVYLTLGMSRQPMSLSSQPTIDPVLGPRAELVLVALSSRANLDVLWRKLAVLAAGPAVESVRYEPGSRVDLGEAWEPSSRCTGGILAPSMLPPLMIAGNIQIQFLRVIPATAGELAYARIHGSDSVLALWQQQAAELVDLMREPATLR